MKTIEELRDKQVLMQANHLTFGDEAVVVLNYLTRTSLPNCDHHRTVKAKGNPRSGVEAYEVYDAVVIAFLGEFSDESTVTCVKCTMKYLDDKEVK